MELAIIGSKGSGTQHGSNNMRRMALAPKQWIVAPTPHKFTPGFLCDDEMAEMPEI